MAVAGSGEEVKLLGIWASRIALNLKGVDYKFLEEIFGTKSELLIKSNPIYKKIPVLIHDAYREQCRLRHPRIMDVITDCSTSTCAGAADQEGSFPDWLYPSLLGILRAKTEEAKTEAAEQAVAGLQLLEETFQKCCKGKCFFGGDRVGYLDNALGSCLGWLRAAEELGGVKLLNETKTPHLVGWEEQFWSDDAVKEVMPETAKFVEFGKMVRARWNAEPSN